jgi:hypothetical protein
MNWQTLTHNFRLDSVKIMSPGISKYWCEDNIKVVLLQTDWGCLLDLTWPRIFPATAFCKHGNKFSVLLKAGLFEGLKNYYFLNANVSVDLIIKIKFFSWHKQNIHSSQPWLYNEAQPKSAPRSVTATLRSYIFLYSAEKGRYLISAQARKSESGITVQFELIVTSM